MRYVTDSSAQASCGGHGKKRAETVGAAEEMV